MQTIEKHIEQLKSACSESIDNGQPIKVPEAMAFGDMLPQGDIGLLMLESISPNWEQIDWPKEGDLQLAPGNSKGSRHTIPRKYKHLIRLYRVNDGNPLSDLGIKADGKFDLEHPEHADHLGYPEGIYRVHHQQNAQRERVMD